VLEPAFEVLMPVYGLRGLSLPGISEVTAHLGEVVPEPQGPILPMPGRDVPRFDEPPPPKKIDPVTILFADEEHLLRDDAQRAAFEAAYSAATNRQRLAVVIQRASILQEQTFTVVNALGRAARVAEVPIYVPHLG
jgi:hypothetical protein